MAASEICRLCFEHETECLDIFLDPEGPFKIIHILDFYSIIEVTQDDEISNKICSKCWNQIHDFHEFCLRIQKIQESTNSIIYVDTKSDVYEVVLPNACEDNVGDDDDNGGDNIQNKTDKVDEVIPYKNDDLSEVERVENSDDVEEITVYINEDESVSLDKKETSPVCNKSSVKRNIKKVRKKPTDHEDTHENLINSFFELSCELCKENFDCCTQLFGHYESQHKIRGYITCCEVKYFKIIKIAEHVLRHKNPDMFKCSKCSLDTVFSDKKQLEAHMLTHLEPHSTIFQCEDCEKAFVKKYRYNQHRLSHLSADEKKFVCQDCGKPYATESLLRVHVRVVHLKSYAHVCEICSKVFKSRVFFEKHQLEHMGQSLPKIQCQICKTWMKNEHTMRAHRRLHEDEGTVHECDICGKTGPSRNSILKHKRYVHLSERTFKCTSCPKAFKRAVSLKEHMTLHTGEVLYKCTFCTKTFNSGANMFAHKKKMHFNEWKMEKDKNNKKKM
ncbi:transcription factor grauzone-like [Episyrphus balteatus]|uniref:transcription factor grauzone-like n=1 Tax=Episyrphus balteatus TaxID=286459 RepID=UPI002485004F|nr:transcription factor grauzone-like [Episyrphus balteatus]